MIEEFQELMNAVQDYRQHKADSAYGPREYGYLRARIERTWREGSISRMQMMTLIGVMEERR